MRLSKPNFIEIKTIETKVSELVSRCVPEATPEEVDKFRPLLTRLVLLEEQNT
jgi:hypothetical protein